MLGLGGYFYGGKQWENKEETPMPKDVPDVDEIGATSAPLLSASYYIGDKCKPFNDDFLLCKQEHNGGTLECMKEGRRVTRCAISVLKDINKYCFDEFKLHYECLEQNNQYFNRCRSSEGILSKCVFNNMKLIKKIPDVEQQIQNKKNPIYPIDPNDIKNTKEFLKSKELANTSTSTSTTIEQS
ncbi:NADH dehydrogenase [ubiquinone] 1 alpha subcomplex subunit, putative [Candida dubliniensis CD36]|uniref:NADH-ubiquinone oxidoreductase n=1 Tax=Candida dubliniensis (strain CD36 / ATCC MYA-646 / CBS 7987 / NCPF 3949 / NRRL Y-17841) TaxID=573826 RepID=B9WL68_CANDC|nr:NADH dehydrogenase [ubiquinone] 1 alpha subcomplex subunit, putative [Candida dubliniensis CD36]CAX39773.1 NADH dehydrogenase [ubiquinone] 1 alpha subcomplex subunit, putative [Candida dubliniensis CD36]